MKKYLRSFLFLIMLFVHGFCFSQNLQTSIPQKIKDDPQFNSIDPEYWKTDVESLISIQTAADIDLVRSRLISFLWGTKGLPLNELPSKIDTDFQDDRYADLYETSLWQLDRIEITMEFGLQSIIYYFLPKKSQNILVLFHQGHQGDFFEAKNVIAELLKNGYAVAAFSMPLLGLNNQPTVFLPRFGYLKLTSHDHLKFLSPEQGHQVKYFLQPVIVFLNYADKNYDYRHVVMIGISGGGWTTTLATAIDVRIQTSFPVAGTYPIYLRSNSQRDWGDWEQTVPELYRTANYLEMYLLGAYGNNRSQLQIINQYDSCCFAGLKWQTYQDVVKNRLNDLGAGKWDLFLDDSHAEHLISKIVLTKILSELNSK